MGHTKKGVTKAKLAQQSLLGRNNHLKKVSRDMDKQIAEIELRIAEQVAEVERKKVLLDGLKVENAGLDKKLDRAGKKRKYSQDKLLSMEDEIPKVKSRESDGRGTAEKQVRGQVFICVARRRQR